MLGSASTLAEQVLHQPRVAWDLARTVVSSAEADDRLYGWFARRLDELLGADYRQQLVETRQRLRQAFRVDAHQVQVGVWRVRLEDLLRRQPELAEDLHALRRIAQARLLEHCDRGAEIHAAP